MNRKFAAAAVFALLGSTLAIASLAAKPTHPVHRHKAAKARTAAVAAALPVTVSPNVPGELNPSAGGAPKATLEQAAAFAWQEFIALNWPAGPQQGQLNQRDTPSTTCKFGDPASTCTVPTVWETFRSKAETFPGTGNPPGYVNDATKSYGYDALPAYNYLFPSPVSSCDPAQADDPVPWVNLDETDQITLDSMYAGVVDPSSSPHNSAPQLIRFLAKSNRTQFNYVAANQWWSAVPPGVVSATKAYLAANQASPPAGSTTLVSQLNGTIEAKAAWRPLNPSEMKSGRFHTQMVRFYEPGSGGGAVCYRDAVWGLVALHIIQKTPSAPYFIYATFEQADNILTADGKPVEDADGKPIGPLPATATSPQTCLVDPKPGGGMKVPSVSGQVIVTNNPATCQPVKTPVYCGAPKNQLYYRNTAFPPTNNQPADGNICVNRRDNAIPAEVVQANAAAHLAIQKYLTANGIASAPWLTYKLVNVQYFPYDKAITKQTPNGSLYAGKPPYSAQHPAPSTYYQANIVVETNRSLQLFSGGLSPNVATDWNQDGTEHTNSEYGGASYTMGGCMGCHGSQGQNPAGQAGDFSVILARGSVVTPEAPAQQTSKGMTTEQRNRSLTK